MEKMIIFGLHIESGLLKSIHDTKNGLECNCICPNCKEKLVKKGHGDSLVPGKRRAHFAHFSGKECEGAYESTIHKLAKQIISKEMKIFLPGYTNKGISLIKSLPTKEVIFTKGVRIEEDQVLLKRRPDAIGVLENGTEIWIEFAYSHFVSGEKLNTIIQKGIECIEIDLRGIEMDENILREFLINDSTSREWINHPSGDKELQTYCIENGIKQDELRKLSELESKGRNVGNKIKYSYISDRFEQRDLQFEKEGRISLERSSGYIAPINCPSIINRMKGGCNSCEYNIEIYQNPEGYSLINCAYGAKRKMNNIPNKSSEDITQLGMNFNM